MHFPLQGFGDVYVALPLGATSPRPMILAVHGREDRPDWACSEWRGVAGPHPFIVCPHGVPVGAPAGTPLTFGGIERTRVEVQAAIAAVKARYGPYLVDGPMVYAGFSLGAILGVSLVAEAPARFPVVVLGEGGHDAWTPARVSAFAAGGGQRVLFACSTAVCERDVAAPVARLKAAGVSVKMVSAGHIGHFVDSRMVDLLHATWPWVLEELQAYPEHGWLAPPG